MAKTHRLQANLNEMTDEQLCQFLAYNYHRLKDLEAARKNDPIIAELQEKLKEAQAFYNAESKVCLNNVKAGRALCEVRGIQFSLPTEKP